MLLVDGWKLADFAPGQGIAHGVHLADYVDEDWLPVRVPGDVHRTLIEAGRIADPFWDRNEAECVWMEEREWWYRLRFSGTGELGAQERQRLIFHGLDTFATVWLNGEMVGEHQNMFRPATFDVGDRLQANNVVAIRFDPPSRRVRAPTQSPWRSEPRSGMRKAQFGYGWDWGPRLPTVGIWRPVELVRQRGAALVGVHCATIELSRQHDLALLAVRVELDRFSTQAPLTAELMFQAPDGRAPIEHTVELGMRGDVTAYVTLENPLLWWTHDLGEAALYQLQVRVLDNGREIDALSTRVGIRTLALDQSPDPEEPGTRFFRFVLNGIPVFARGANWIPCDSFVGAIEPARYRALVQMARDSNMTMLRVWGGGLYEHEAFYDACDELGLLVWQDFMFACASYPEVAAFANEVDAEARYQVRRLRGHPSLALWCGNNENQWLIERALWDKPTLPPYGALYYDDILPHVVAELDGRTPYWPSSPYGGSDHNAQSDGDTHNWDVWHGNYPRRFGEEPRREFTPESVSYLRYAEDEGRFISEFGMHAAPALETLRRAIPQDQLWHHSPSLDWHNKDNPKNKGDNLMLGVTGLPTSLQHYLDFSQLAQAEGLKFGVEHFRRRKPHCSGTLVWQFDDCWPVLSWSLVDYYGFPKGSYYYLRRAYAPRLACFKRVGTNRVELWIVNDSLAAWQETLKVRCCTFDGRMLLRDDVAIDVAANSSASVRRFDLRATADCYVSVAGSFGWNRELLVPIKGLVRPTAHVSAEFDTADGALEARVRSDAYALFVHWTYADEQLHFSDNFFDLPAGETRTVRITHPGRVPGPDELTLSWR